MSSAAMELVLDAFEAAIGPTGPNPLHHRIEHALQVTDEQLARLVAMDIPTVIHLDGAADWVHVRGGPGRVRPRQPRQTGRLAHPLARLRGRRAARRLGDRRAVDLPGPGCGRADRRHGPARRPDRRRDGRAGAHEPETPPWLLDQLLTAEQGLRAVTLDAAWALGDEARRGHLAPGTLGDVTILTGDVTTLTPDEIRAMEVVATIVGGVPAHCADAAVCSRLGG